MQDLSIPYEFVWTKFGTESGEVVEEIFARKDEERNASGGIFLWGIGNNVGTPIRTLTGGGCPEVLFSPIASPARSCDEAPSAVVRWTSAESLDGEHYEIPKASVVTSRWTENKRHHFALVCYSDIPLQPSNGAQHVYVDSLRNLVSGKKVGSSQVTSVVERFDCKRTGRVYPVALRIKLVAPYFVRLLNPAPLPARGVSRSVRTHGFNSPKSDSILGVTKLSAFWRKPLKDERPRKC